ncbi:MAG: DUF4855 domain-containing protein, partial [Clostridia bacterium]|nr:DUF4855 domain-containing protein [Clostridia bacterium]
MSAYYTNKPIVKVAALPAEEVTAERKNLILGLPIHSIEEKVFFSEKGDRPHTNYDTDSLLLTDGIYSPDENYKNKEWFHINRGGGRLITFKLPCLCAVDGFLLSTCRNDEVAVRTPTYVKIRVSADGENFKTVYDNGDTRSHIDRRNFIIKGDFEKTAALYVQLAIDVVHHVYIDEFEIFGCTDTSGALMPVADGLPVFNEHPLPAEINKYPEEDVLGAKNIALTYNFRPAAEDKGLLAEEDYLPLTAYLDGDGSIKDTFMDGFLFLPDVSLDHTPRGQFAVGWKEYMDSVFVKGKNLDALNSAAKKTGDALGNPEYKVKVYFTLLYTYTHHSEFGTVNGEKLVFDNPESRKKAIRWLIDYMLAEYEKGGYSNTEVGGFYWFEEALNPTDRYEKEIIRDTCEYIHSKGYKCFWIPYFCALGYEDWQSYGFDCACMQPNYMFDYDIPQ